MVIPGDGPARGPAHGSRRPPVAGGAPAVGGVQRRHHRAHPVVDARPAAARAHDRTRPGPGRPRPAVRRPPDARPDVQPRRGRGRPRRLPVVHRRRQLAGRAHRSAVRPQLPAFCVAVPPARPRVGAGRAGRARRQCAGPGIAVRPGGTRPRGAGRGARRLRPRLPAAAPGSKGGRPPGRARWRACGDHVRLPGGRAARCLRSPSRRRCPAPWTRSRPWSRAWDEGTAP